jgi:hypothetical protein
MSGGALQFSDLPIVYRMIQEPRRIQNGFKTIIVERFVRQKIAGGFLNALLNEEGKFVNIHF